MMNQAFYTGVSGLKNYSTGIDIVANNLANISTVGFRSYNAEFASLFEDTLQETSTMKSDSVGGGVRVQASGMNNTQGTLMIGDRSSDLAILGDGWFGIIGEQDETIYTRDGAFSIDANADLVTADGYYVLGTLAGNISKDNVLTQQLEETPLGDVSTQEKLRFPQTLSFPPQPSTKVDFLGNIGVGYEPVAMGAALIDAENNRNDLKLVFTKDPQQTPPGTQYNVVATLKSPDGQTLYDTQSGRVTFDGRGALLSSTLTTINNNGTEVSINLGKGFEGIISIDTPKTSYSSSVDGTLGGELIDYTINENADIIASFSNGEQSSIGKVAVYHFQNEQGLSRVSGTRFQESANSGKAQFYKDLNGQNVIGTTVVNYRLESSNVNMAIGLTELIILQRSYDANSKSVTTADQMMQKALEMDA